MGLTYSGNAFAYTPARREMKSSPELHFHVSDGNAHCGIKNDDSLPQLVLRLIVRLLEPDLASICVSAERQAHIPVQTLVPDIPI